MSSTPIAIIAGTGFYSLAQLDGAETVTAQTPFGTAQFTRGTWHGIDVIFLTRHGAGHSVPPHLVNYRANIRALKDAGVHDVFAINVVGSVDPTLQPGDLLCLDDFLDFTKTRVITFFDGSTPEGVVHTDVMDAYHPALRAEILSAATQVNQPMRNGGVYACFEGPRFESPAEIRNLDYIVTVDDKSNIVRNADVLIVDGVIAAIGDVSSHPAAAQATVLDGSGKLLMPGMVNLHTHTPMTLLRGLSEDVDLQGFLKLIWAAEGAAMDPDTVQLGAQLGALESLQSGSTTQLDMYFHHVETHRGALEVGTRHVIGPVFMDFLGPDNKTWDQRLEMLQAWPQKLAAMGGPLTPVALCPHGTYTIAPERLREIIDNAKQLGMNLLSIHISENAAENVDVMQRFGKTPTELMYEIGALDGAMSVVFAHGVHLNESDRVAAAKASAAVAHCPGSNLKLASGALHWRNWNDGGIRVGIGTDGCSTSNDLDMFQAMRQAALLARLTVGKADVTPSIEFVRAATIEGARALGLGDVIGSIEVGKRADLVLLDLDAPHLTPVHDVHALLVFAAGRGDVCDVFVDGEHVLKDRLSTKVDQSDLLRRARERGVVAAKAAAEA